MTPPNVQDLAALSLELLVEELGTEGARLFLREAFSKYRPDYKGLGRDSQPAKKNAFDPRGAQQNAHKHGPR
ncbi:hypothetical protein [Pseudomonas boanensis]|uniref:hypothetical protein n=1 Tax=Metapseudomonas boanensis TaxID=2822138 RepID=UPI0035D45DF1